MALTVDQDERLTLLLQALEPCLKDLPGRSKGFVEDQIKRHDEYGARVFMSPKQWAWLEDLYKTHVGGTLPEADDKPEDDVEHGGSPVDDMDDEIPF